MDIIQAVILGIIEGITEFLPISSTGHLIVVSHWLSIHQSDTNKAFEVIIQFAAILAVVVIYKDRFSLKHRVLWGKIILAFIPIGCVGLLFHHQIMEFFTVSIVGIMFIVGGVVFLIIEYFYKEGPAHVVDLEKVSYRQALWIGIAQIFALIPGTSRAGSSIVGAMLVGLSRKASAEFSFLLAVPVLTAAAGFDMVKHYRNPLKPILPFRLRPLNFRVYRTCQEPNSLFPSRDETYRINGLGPPPKPSGIRTMPMVWLLSISSTRAVRRNRHLGSRRSSQRLIERDWFRAKSMRWAKPNSYLTVRM